MTSRMIDLSDGVWGWLEAYAKDRDQSVDEHLESVVRYYMADASTAALRQRIAHLEQALEAARKDPALPRTAFNPANIRFPVRP